MVEFDPRTMTKKDMKNAADHIESYMEVLFPLMIIPDDIYDESAESVKKAKKYVKKLIKRLNDGDKEKVFKDDDDWNII